MIRNFPFNFLNLCFIVCFFFDYVTNIRYFIFNSSKCIIITLVSNTKYFIFNLIYFSIKSSTTSLSCLLKSTGTGTNLSTSNLSTLLFKSLKLVCKFFNLLISYLSTLDFKLARSTFLANFDVSKPAAFFKSAFVA